MGVADLCGKQQKQKQQQAVLQQLDQQQAVITAVKLPLPITASAAVNGSSGSNSRSSSSVAFWSHKLTTHRYSNEHAAVNAAIWLQAPTSSSNGPGAAGSYTLRIAVGTYQQQPTSSGAAHACNGTSSLHTTGEQQQTGDTSPSHSEGSWVCTRAHALEAALLQVLTQQQQQEGAQQSLLQVLAGVSELLLQDIQPAGRLAGYVR
jgi:hypothetical protein